MVTAPDRVQSAARSVWQWTGQTDDYWLVRFVFLRLLGFVYLFAYLSLAWQVLPLLGSNGILPAEDYLLAFGTHFDSTLAAFLQQPTIFWFGHSDILLLAGAWLGVVLSLLIFLGAANVPLLAVNWLLYLSYVNVGQTFYAYGWELQLVETGFLAIFLVPLLNWRPFPRTAPPVPVIWLLRWLAVRIHIGAGLIKIRGDACWRNLTCLQYHFETQPIPNPVSPWLHALPGPALNAGVAYNHLAELFAPFTATMEPLTRAYNRAAARCGLPEDSMERARRIRIGGGIIMLLLQVILIVSGNLSFLNWLTLLPVLAFFDDRFLSRFFPRYLIDRAWAAKRDARMPPARRIISLLLIMLIAILSVPAVANILSPTQVMNASFDPFNLVNSYGAFGAVTKQRPELIVQGSRTGESWKTYDVPAKPDSPKEPLPVVAPYQPRLAWQFWFAAMSQPQREPWLLHLTWKLLRNDPAATALLAHNPFPEEPPRYIRILRYQYRFTPPLTPGTWTRSDREVWLPPVTRNTTALNRYVQHRWDPDNPE